MSVNIKLPDEQGKLQDYVMQASPVKVVARPSFTSRIAMAATHVVVDPLAGGQPGEGEKIDFDTTISVRCHLASLGFGIAEVMDTSQRGMGLAPAAAMELVEKSNAALVAEGYSPVFAGCGTDDISPDEEVQLDDLVDAYLRQVEKVQNAGARVIVMASRKVAEWARNADDYVKVYKEVLGACEKPAILHWLGEMFDPALRGYWGADEMDEAIDCVLGIIKENSAKVDGIKVSLLDKDIEIEMRRRLPEKVRMYTGDDFNYPELITGDEKGHSDALLGILGPIAPVASEALEALDNNDAKLCRKLLASTEPLSRHIFCSPTYHYKTGVVFLAWLNGLQNHFVMLSGAQAMRPLPYFARLFRLADECGLLSDPMLATHRMNSFLSLYGLGK